MTPTMIVAKRYQLVVNVYQACILCLFNTKEEITYDELKQMTQIQDGELNPALIFMCNPKVKLLLKGNPKTPEFKPTETLKANPDFANPSIKVNLIPVPSKKQTVEKAEEAKSDDKEIKMERQNITDATIVRIMKARKQENHNDLLIEVTRQIQNFVAQPALIKQRIESLIERDYLKRDEENRGRYIYLP